ncbi:hypothetical protein [Halobacteriovorax sp. HLS]|uniref:hypothetical protein n=1 Tax=Halobacteriovorax sp. HLS TaxID=2234000 RepID=UPI000FDC9CB9|nr:hypothetical protein [Halobacteriovorax sp. HLS]
MSAIKSSRYKCFLKAEVLSLVRPAGTYVYNSNLDKVIHKRATKLKRKEISFYSLENCKKESVTTLLEYNCSDKDSSLKDYELIDLHRDKASVLDQWTGKKEIVDCSTHLPN